jgi:hypothetical protein
MAGGPELLSLPETWWHRGPSVAATVARVPLPSRGFLLEGS